MKGTTRKERILMVVDTIEMCPRAQTHGWAIARQKGTAGTLTRYYLVKVVDGKVHHPLRSLRADELHRYTYK